MSQTSILLPCVAMVGLTAAVAVRLYVQRIGEMRARRIRPQAIATSTKAAEKLQKVNAADNFRNLFEVPVLFYALCLALLATQSVNQFYLAGAWTYVGLRVMHSVIHCTYNNVNHRFAAYLLSTLDLFLMWGVFGAHLLEVLR